MQTNQTVIKAFSEFRLNRHLKMRAELLISLLLWDQKSQIKFTRKTGRTGKKITQDLSIMIFILNYMLSRSYLVSNASFCSHLEMPYLLDIIISQYCQPKPLNTLLLSSLRLQNLLHNLQLV